MDGSILREDCWLHAKQRQETFTGMDDASMTTLRIFYGHEKYT